MLLQNKLLQAVMEYLPVGVFAKDPADDYRIVLWNKQMVSLLGIPQNDAIGATDFDFFDDNEEANSYRETDKRVMSQGEVIEIESEVVTTPSGKIICHTLKAPLTLDDGNKLLLGIIEDITQEVSNKKQLEEYRCNLETLVQTRTEQLQELADHDSLTGLKNRSFLLSTIANIIKQRDTKEGFAVIFIDLDGFKLLNDSYGHHLGDRLLREVGERLAEFGSSVHTVARLGGDEFVLLVETSDRQMLAKLAISIYDSISQPFNLRDQCLRITCSLGISLWPDNAEESALLLQAADMAMYKAKQSNKKNNFYFYNNQMLIANKRKVGLEQALRDALASDQFYLVLQPQYTMDEPPQLIGAEVLTRWQSDKFGLVPPSEFIPIAERSGLMPAISNWILSSSCRLINHLKNHCDRLERISINLSASDIDSSLAERINKQLALNGLAAESLTLEITETQLINFSTEVVDQLELLRNQGLRISIDDFGTGYSSIAYLSQVSFDELKIDRSFVEKIGGDNKNQNLLRTIIGMAEALGCEIVAEGVETPEQLKCLQDMGVDMVQGYLLGKPMLVDEFVKKSVRS